MPRKAKDVEARKEKEVKVTKTKKRVEKEEIKKSVKKVSSKKLETTSSNTKNKSTKNLTKEEKQTGAKKQPTKKMTNVKTPSKKVSSKKQSATSNTSVKKASSNTDQKEKVAAKKTTVKKATDQKVTTKKASAKKSTTKKATTKKATTKKATTKKVSSKVSSKKISSLKMASILEYYDLPYRYNQTVVKLLAQTPQTLFVYWDVSDKDRLHFTEVFGEDFFSKTKPVLIVHNETMNYSFELEINDFANSWYLQVKDPNCKYVIELGRRPLSYMSEVHNNYIYVTSSNEMDAPNDHILFEKFKPDVLYKNVHTGKQYTKNLGSLSDLHRMQKIYHIYDLYKEIYQNELLEEFEHGNPSSMSSSQFRKINNI